MAAEAEAFAAQSRFTETRAEYLALAKAWRMLARNVGSVVLNLKI
jgi:hypothetical protein